MKKAMDLMIMFLKGTGCSCILAVIAYLAGMSNNFIAATLFAILVFAFATLFTGFFVGIYHLIAYIRELDAKCV